jgi:hypothetical protein
MVDCLVWQLFDIHEVPYVWVSRIRRVFRVVGGWENFENSLLPRIRTILDGLLSHARFWSCRARIRTSVRLDRLEAGSSVGARVRTYI